MFFGTVIHRGAGTRGLLFHRVPKYQRLCCHNSNSFFHIIISLQTPVEIQILIEDGEERFTEDQINQLLDLVQTELLGASVVGATDNKNAP